MPPSSAPDATELNRRAWEADRFDAWCSAYGPPEAAAVKIVADPGHILRRLMPYMGDVRGRHVCSVQGSHGRVAVALACLGADVFVVDFSEENRRYAMALAAAGGVEIGYAVCDVMEAEYLGRNGTFDLLILELGILHYHQHLDRFFAVLRSLVKDGGSMVLNEFHPVQRKLFWQQGPHDYFWIDLVEADVPNPEPQGDSLGRCLYRFWTLGEIVAAAVEAGFSVLRLDEHPDWSDPSIPGTFTLLAKAA